MPFGVERLFTIDIEGVKLRGYSDRSDKLDSGGLCIVDCKTNQEPFSMARLVDNLQLTLYHLAAEQYCPCDFPGIVPTIAMSS